ncbi:MAG: HAD family hydrolase [Candidatus Kerfeldbacteria bacterium]|nr:HAD family hydrolase [Candidatus Kerfeldbacteria bacterium]
MIRHLWFDFSETIVVLRQERHDRLRYESYAAVVHQPVTDALMAEYNQLYKVHKQSNAAVFRSLGLPGSYWSGRVNSVAPLELYQLADPSIPSVLEDLKELLPISIFSNIKLESILPSFRISPLWFTNILSAGMVKEPKPALDGFKKMVELSRCQPAEILYIGDDIEKDVRPAKQVGIRAGLMWHHSPEADFQFERFSDMLSLVKSLPASPRAANP